MIDAAKLCVHCYDVIGAIKEVHRRLGPGLNEYIYQEALEMELKFCRIPYERELAFHPKYRDIEMKAEYRLDFLCKEDIIVELKSVTSLCSDHRAQLFNYLRLREASVGIIVNYAPKFAVIETYLYDKDTKELLSRDGKPLQQQLFTRVR